MSNIKKTIQQVGTVLLVTYAVIPSLFYYSPHLRRFLVFGNFFRWPFQNYTNPESYNLPQAKYFTVNSVDATLGAWYIPPKSQWKRHSRDISESMWFSDERPIIIYVHGHAECRAAFYRVQLYRTLSQHESIDAHVVTFDYRGFGDSTFTLPDRQGILYDALSVYEHIRKFAPEERIIVWGHSLGTGVAMQMAEAFTEMKTSKPAAIVLEAPFASLVDAAMNWPLGYPYRLLKDIFQPVFEILKEDETHYESIDIAHTVSVPILVLHSKDDPLVMYENGRRLFEALEKRVPPGVTRPQFVEVDSSFGPGHRHIYKDPAVHEAVAQFIKEHVNKRTSSTSTTKAP